MSSLVLTIHNFGVPNFDPLTYQSIYLSTYLSIEHTAPACGAELRDGPTAEQASLLAAGALEAQGMEGMGGDRKYPLVISNSYPLVMTNIAIENGHL